MLRIAGFKVKVILRGQRTYDFFPFPSVTLEPLEGFWRNLTQMFSRLRRCAEAMFRMDGFKVKVVLRGQRPQMLTRLRQCAEACSGFLDSRSRSYVGVKGHMTFPFCSVTLEALEGFWRNLTQMLTRLRRRADAMLRIAGFKIKVRLRGQRTYDCFPVPSVTLEALERFRRNLTQMLTSLRGRAEAMFRMAGFKVKVILRGQRPYDFSLLLCNSWTHWMISKKPDTNVNQTQMTCRSNVPDGWIQGQGHTLGSKAIWLFPFRSVTLEPLEGFQRNLTQMFTRLRRRA